jgi:ParB family chromosome partitioning protein
MKREPLVPIKKELLTVLPDALDTTGPWLFLHDPEAPCEDITAAALQALGQVQACLVVREGDGYRLITGLEIFICLRETGTPVQVQIIEADALEKGLLVLAEASGKPLGHGMQVAALRYFSAHADEGLIEEKVRPLLGHGSASALWARLKAWLTLSEAWDEHLKAERLPLEAVDVLTRLKADDLDALKPFFASISWSKNNAVNFLTWLWETSVREGKSVEALLGEAGMAELLDSGLSPKDATAKLMQKARRLRYPTLCEMEERFTRRAKEITAGTRWTLQPSKNFESEAVTLSVRIKGEGELEKARKELADLSKEKSLGELFSKKDES